MTTSRKSSARARSLKRKSGLFAAYSDKKRPLGGYAALDLVTSPFRAPFVKFKKSAGAGEVEEEARGQGLQEAVGDLITCPYCMAPWIAAVLVFASGRAPRSTRIVSAIFTIAAGSDFLNRLYSRAKG